MAEGKSPEEKAQTIVNWAEEHISSPCGQTPEQRKHMEKQHIAAVAGALKEPGVSEALTREQVGLLRGLGINIGGREKKKK